MDRSFGFGERVVIGLFRGAGGLLGLPGGDGSSGMDALGSLIEAAFQDYALSSLVFDSYEGSVFSFREVGSGQALALIDPLDRVGALGLVGYSAGGLSAIRTAQGLAPEAVDLLVQIDSYVPLFNTSDEDKVLPGTVAKGLNYYQVANRFNPFRPGFDLFDLQGATAVAGSENINVESLLGDRSITHRTIVNDPRVQNQILQDIEQYMLQDVTFDREEQLNLSGGAELRNNILSLAPGVDGTAGGAFIAEDFAIAPDVSFQTRFEFRLPTASTGFSFWLQPTGEPLPGQALSSLAITFEPFTLQTGSTEQGAIALLTPSFSSTPLIQASAGLPSGTPLTAWVDYSGTTDLLSVFLADTLTQPDTPLFTYELDLPGIVGSSALVGFQTTTQDGEGRADLLTWDFTATDALLSPGDVVAQKPADCGGQADLLFEQVFEQAAENNSEEYAAWVMDAPLLGAGGSADIAETVAIAGELENLAYSLPLALADYYQG